jgi:hypothetical protein
MNARNPANENVEGGDQNLSRLDRIERERDVVAGGYQEIPSLFDDTRRYSERSRASSARPSPTLWSSFRFG